MNQILSMRIILICAITLSCGGRISAQSFSENGLLFGRTTPGGSARIQALGGTQIALGGDFSSALSNPAGLGMYNRSELTLSIGVNSKNYITDYLSTSTESTESRFSIPGFSVVLHFEPNSDSESSNGFLGGSLGIAFTRVNDLNMNYHYHGLNSETSLIDYYLDYSNNGGDPIAEYEFLEPDGYDYYTPTALALETGLIVANYDGNNLDSYGSDLNPYPDETRTLTQYESYKRKGAQYQWSIAYGANFSDKLFIGGNIGITTIRYKLEQTFRESDFVFSGDLDYKPLDYHTLHETYDIQGSGVNLTLGLTYRPVNFLQLGAAFTTPTLSQITDNYKAGVRAQWLDSTPASSEFGESLLSEYSLTTPLKLGLGIAFISKYGLISSDVEFVNYGRARYSSEIDGVDFDYDNKEIKSTYGKSINLRTGIEFRYKIFRLRSGVNIMGGPDRYDSELGKITTYSGGVGIRVNKFFGDFALISSRTDNTRLPYSSGPLATQKIKTTTGMITVGYAF